MQGRFVQKLLLQFNNYFRLIIFLQLYILLFVVYACLLNYDHKYGVKKARNSSYRSLNLLLIFPFSIKIINLGQIYLRAIFGSLERRATVDDDFL